MPVAIYARISSDREQNQAGVERQKEDCLAHARKNILEVVETIVDNDKSAYRRTKPRPGWERIKQMVAEGRIDGIVAWHVDRLYRHPADLEDVLAQIEGRELRIHTVTSGEMDLNTPAGRLSARILGSVAANEVEHKAARQARKHLEIAQSGRWQGGIVPTGYRRAGRGALEIDEPVAEAIREAADRIITGHSLASTVAWFREAANRPNMKAITLKGVLTGWTVAGYRAHIPQKSRDIHNAARARKQISGDLPREMGTYKANWDPILDEPTWHAVRRILLDPARRSSGKRPEKSLLSGVLECGLCGHTLGYSAHAYACGKNVGGCGKLAVSTNAVESHILDMVGHFVAKMKLERPEEIPEESPAPHDWNAMRAELLDLRRRQVISLAELEVQLEAISKESEAYEKQREARAASRSARGHVQSIAEDWDNADKAERRTIINALIDRVVVHPSMNGRKSGSKFNYERIAVKWRTSERSEPPEKPSVRF